MYFFNIFRPLTSIQNNSMLLLFCAGLFSKARWVRSLCHSPHWLLVVLTRRPIYTAHLLLHFWHFVGVSSSWFCVRDKPHISIQGILELLHWCASQIADMLRQGVEKSGSTDGKGSLPYLSHSRVVVFSCAEATQTNMVSTLDLVVYIWLFFQFFYTSLLYFGMDAVSRS